MLNILLLKLMCCETQSDIAKGQGKFLPLCLVADQAIADYFHNSVTNIVHPPYPLHRGSLFQLLRNTLAFCHLLNQPHEHFFRLLVNARKIAIQFSSGFQADIGCSMVFLKIAQMTLPPYADYLLSV